MLLAEDINPVNTVYFNGGVVLEKLKNSNGNKFDFFKLYELINSSNSISFNSYILALDWLYLLGAIKLDDKGFIEKCF